jgi:NDP-sugar pyrophosphorylase family protein
VVLSLGYLPDVFEAHLAAHPPPVAVRLAVEHEPLGTAGAIRFAAEGITEPFVVCNGDILTALDLGALVRFHEAHGAEATIHLTEVDDPSSFGVVPTRPDGEVVAFVEKPTAGTAPSRWINAGTYVLDPAVLERIPPRLMVSVERETFPRMLDEPGRLYAMRSDAYWIDIGSPDDYVRAHLDLLDRALVAVTSDHREVAPGVFAQGDVQIAPDAVLVAPLVLGAGVVVEPGARVQQSTLADAVRIGRGARVLRSVLHEASTVDADAEVADSVIGARATVGEGARVGARTVVGAGAAVAAHARVANAKLQVS